MVKSIAVPSPTFSPPISGAFGRRTSFPELADGPTRFASPDGPTTDLYGPARHLASHSAQPENAAATQTSAISGQLSFDLSSNAGLPLSSESRSLPPMSSAQISTRMCSLCGAQKPSSEFRNGSKGRKYLRCKDCIKRADAESPKTKPRIARANKAWRSRNRGWSLVSSARDRAKAKGLPLDITFQEIQDRVTAGFCEATGIPFNLTVVRAWNSPSLDQIEPGKGYTRDNTRVVIYAYNVMANVWGEPRILEVSTAILEQRKRNSNDLSLRLAERLKATIDLNGSPEYELTWRDVVTTSGHQYSRLAASARRISDNGSSGWPTPGAIDATSNSDPLEAKQARGSGGINLTTAARMAGWGTPTSQDAKHNGLSPSEANRDPNVLRNQVHQVAGWATPRSSDADKNVRSPEGAAKEIARKGPQNDLGLVSGLMPNGSNASTEKRGALNAGFSLWLQGYPPQWMDSAPSAASARSRAPVTRSSRKSRRNS